MDKQQIELFTVNDGSTIEHALAQIERNSHRSVIVVDDSQRVVGTLSDGDVRKAMLAHRLLTTPVGEIMNLNFVSVQSEDLERAPALFEKYHLFIIPVVGPSNELVDVLTAY